MVNLDELELAPDVIWIGVLPGTPVQEIRDYPSRAAAQAAFEALW